MIEFVLGIIVGLLNALFVLVVLIYYRRVIEHKTTIIEKMIENAGPRPKGGIYMPPDENDELREQIIEKNRREGKDTKFEELL